MVKKFLLALSILLYSGLVIGSEILINRDCLFYSDLFVNGGEKELLCSFAPGDERVLNRSFLYSLMKQYSKFKPKFKLNEKVIVKRKGTLLTEPLIKDLIITLYRKTFPNVKIKIEKFYAYKKIYFANVDDLKLSFMNRPKFGSVYFLLFNGYKNYRIYGYIRGFKEVFITKERVKKNDTLEEKVIKKRMEITKVIKNPISDIHNYVASKTIPANRIVTTNYVMKKPDLFKGDYVKLIYKSKYILATTMGILEENAYKRNYIKVKNPSSGKTVVAKYIGDKIAIISDY